PDAPSVHCLPPSPTHILSLHDALPIYLGEGTVTEVEHRRLGQRSGELVGAGDDEIGAEAGRGLWQARVEPEVRTPSAVNDERCRSEEHTSELQSRFDLVCRLLLEKKKK